jgi:cysteine desulfurase
MRVYLDYAATSPIRPEVVKAMAPYLKAEFGNPSSIHSFGQSAKEAVDKARKTIADFLNAKEIEIIFTGSGSEADNLAIRGLVKSISNKIHIITSTFEHHAVLKTCEELEKNDWAEVTYIKPDKNGLIEVEKIKKAIRKNTVLISIMYVNNEVGSIQPIREIGKMIEKENENRSKVSSLTKIYFHTDAVQATQYLPMDVDYLHVDMLTIAGHKIGAPKGIGALYVRKNTPIRPIITGGGQEFNLRAGTENVPYIVGLAKAIEMVVKEKNKREKIGSLRKYFIDQMSKDIPDCFINGFLKQAPHIINVYFKDIEGESIILSLDLEGVACSTGSACTSQSLEPSHVIMSIFNDHFRAAGSVRFSIAKETTKKEIDFAVKKISKVIRRLRLISPYSKESK